jgi:hypothetical protein
LQDHIPISGFQAMGGLLLANWLHAGTPRFINVNDREMLAVAANASAGLLVGLATDFQRAVEHRYRMRHSRIGMP